MNTIEHSYSWMLPKYPHAVGLCMLYMFVKQVWTKRALRQCQCIVSALWVTVFRSHPAASASHSEKQPEDRMDERWELRHAKEPAFSLTASMSARWVILATVWAFLCVCVCLIVYWKRKTPTHNCVQPLPAAAWCKTHRRPRGSHKREQRGTQVDRKRLEGWNNLEKHQHNRGFATLSWSSSLKPFQKGASMSNPDGCRSLLCPLNTSWQRALQHYWFPFLLDSVKQGSHAQKRPYNNIRDEKEKLGADLINTTAKKNQASKHSEMS